MHLYRIRTKMAGFEGKSILFAPNLVQRTIYKAIEEHNRVIILKPRQLGITTGIVLYALDEAMYKENQNCRTIAHKKDSAIEIFTDKAQFAYKELLRESPDLCPRAEYTTKAELQFIDSGSKFSVATDARGMTPTLLHLTEVAYNEEEAKLEDSIESLPMTAKGVAESTANGFGNWFSTTHVQNWELLQQGRKPEWFPLFFGWFDDPNNAIPIHDYEFHNPDACALQAKKFKNLDGSPLRQAQLIWYDKKLFALGERLPELYPSTPEEAFIFSTGKVYPEFMRAIHVIPRVSFPDYEIAMDYGQTNPQVFQKWHQDFDGNFTCFGEFYKRNSSLREQRGWLNHNCKEKIDKDGWVHVRFPDPTVFGDNQFHAEAIPGRPIEHRSSIADEYALEKILLYRGVQTDKQAGMNRVHDYLRFDPDRRHPYRRVDGEPIKGSPRLFVTEDCTNTIWEYGHYVWPKDPNGALNQSSYEEPVKKNDHGMDCTKNVLLTWGRSVSEGREVEYGPGSVGRLIQSFVETQELEREAALRA